MLAVTGYHSQIVRELALLLGRDEQVVRFTAAGISAADADRYLFCAGVMHGHELHELTQEETAETFEVNFVSVVKACERILRVNPRARICLVGSESGITGSFDKAYAASKAALHHYAENRLVGRGQQLVCVAPSIIEDAGMTMRRMDYDLLATRRNAHPKGRFLLAAEVARLIYFLLYIDEGYVCNTTIRMDGGAHAR